MTLSADTSPDDGGKPNAIAMVPETTGVDPFAPVTPDAPRGLRARMLDYSAHAAMIVGLIGFAWTVGDHVVHRPAADLPTKVAATAPAASAAGDPLTELRTRNRELADTVHALQARLDAVQASVGDQGKVAAQVQVIQSGLESVRNNLGSSRSEQAAAVARLDGKIDKIAREPTSKMQQLVDRLGRIERSSVDVAPTASLPRPEPKLAEKLVDAPEKTVKITDKPAEPKLADGIPKARPVPRPAELKSEDKSESKTKDRGAEPKLASNEDAAKPQHVAGWVVRDVYQGVALIEGRRGTLEVVPGVSIPGAGVVKSIDRHGSGWTVTTTKGLVAYAPPPRDYRRADRGYYPTDRYRYDF